MRDVKQPSASRTASNNYSSLQKTVSNLLHKSVLQLCKDSVQFGTQLQIMGVLCMTIDNESSDIVIKVNETLRKEKDDNGSESEHAVGDQPSRNLPDTSCSKLGVAMRNVVSPSRSNSASDCGSSCTSSAGSDSPSNVVKRSHKRKRSPKKFLLQNWVETQRKRAQKNGQTAGPSGNPKVDWIAAQPAAESPSDGKTAGAESNEQCGVEASRVALQNAAMNGFVGPTAIVGVVPIHTPFVSGNVAPLVPVNGFAHAHPQATSSQQTHYLDLSPGCTVPYFMPVRNAPAYSTAVGELYKQTERLLRHNDSPPKITDANAHRATVRDQDGQQPMLALAEAAEFVQRQVTDSDTPTTTQKWCTAPTDSDNIHAADKEQVDLEHWDDAERHKSTSRRPNGDSAMPVVPRRRRLSSAFKCNQCDSGFATLGDLTQHTVSQHGAYKCTVCSLHFTQRSNLQRHSLRHVGFKPYKCAICAVEYYRKDHLIRHVSTVHSGTDARTAVIERLSSSECLPFLERMKADLRGRSSKRSTNVDNEQEVIFADGDESVRVTPGYVAPGAEKADAYPDPETLVREVSPNGKPFEDEDDYHHGKLKQMIKNSRSASTLSEEQCTVNVRQCLANGECTN